MAYKTLDKSKSYVVLNIREAQGVRPADPNGKSDPYVVVWLNKNKAHTTRVHDVTLDPKWFEKLYIGINKDGSGQAITKELLDEMPVDIVVWDKDKIGSDDFLGIVKLSGADLLNGFDKWFELQADNDNKAHKIKEKVTGKIHVRAKYVSKG